MKAKLLTLPLSLYIYILLSIMSYIKWAIEMTYYLFQ